jgi:hypothetical protein
MSIEQYERQTESKLETDNMVKYIFSIIMFEFSYKNWYLREKAECLIY